MPKNPQNPPMDLERIASAVRTLVNDSATRDKFLTEPQDTLMRLGITIENGAGLDVDHLLRTLRVLIEQNMDREQLPVRQGITGSYRTVNRGLNTSSDDTEKASRPKTDREFDPIQSELEVLTAVVRVDHNTKPINGIRQPTKGDDHE
jgi:hypothetical protein